VTDSYTPLVLTVDDSRAMRSIIRRILEERGFEVAEAADGVEALEALGRLGAVDAVLLDWNMPNMDGFECLRHIRGDAAYDSTRVVMVTTEAEVDRMVAALDEGADEYLMKPFEHEALVERLEQVGVFPPRGGV